MWTFIVIELSNQAPKLRTELPGLISEEPTWMLSMFTLDNCWRDPIIRKSVLLSWAWVDDQPSTPECQQYSSYYFILGRGRSRAKQLYPYHRIDTQPEVRLSVGAFDVGVLVFSAAAIFLASVHGKCLRYTEDVDVVVTKKNSSLLTLERGRWIRMLCDSSNLYKQKLVEPKPLASKMAAVKKVGQKNGEVGVLVR